MRSSSAEVFCKERCSKKFHKTHRKTPVPESLFLIKLQACNFIKKRLRHRCFPVNAPKFLRTSFLTEHLRWLLVICLYNFNIPVTRFWPGNGPFVTCSLLLILLGLLTCYNTSNMSTVFSLILVQVYSYLTYFRLVLHFT